MCPASARSGARSGARPDLPAAAMRATGLDPAGPDVPLDEAALALAERVTGIALTADLLHSATYLAVAMPDSSGDAVRDLTGIRAAGP